MIRTAWVIVCAAVCTVALAGCTSSGTHAPSSSSVSSAVSSAASATGSSTVSAPSTSGAPSSSVGDPTPVSAGPITTTRGTCPLVTSGFVADAIGMRLGKQTVQRSSGRVVGCRIYALQGSPLSRSEHLPGPNQPATEIVLTRYASAGAAGDAVARTAAAGTNLQRTGTISCFQVAFYPPDAGKDWACAFAQGADAVLVRTVVTSPALNALRVAQQVRRGL